MLVKTVKELALINAVRAHARSNYERDGWDMIVECFEDNEILEALKEETDPTPERAIEVLGDIAKTYDDRRKDVQAEIF